MTEREQESGEESIDDEGRNPTQQRIDEEDASEKAADASDDWEETEPSPHQGEEGQEPV